MLPAFLVYLDDLKSFKGVIPKEDFSDALWAVAEYTETGEEPTGLSPMATVLFRTIKAKVDRESEKYERKCEAGGKGGRPKTQTNQTKPTETKENQTKPTETNGNLKNQIEKETETEKETESYNNTTDRAREEETPFGPVTIDPLIVKVQREIVGMTDTHYDLFRQYREDLGDELVSYAIDSAVAQGVRKWAYLETILCKYGTAKYRSVAEVKAAEEERKAAKTRAAPQGKPTKTVHAQQFTQRQYTEEQLDGEMSPLLANALKKVMSEDSDDERVSRNVV